MFGIGAGELMLLLVLALLVLGPERMPRLARDLGKTVGDLRRTSDELKHEFLNADAVIDRAAKLGEPEPAPAVLADPAPLPGGAEPVAPEAPASPPSGETGATQADVAVPDPEPLPAPEPQAEPEPDETAFDREARLARERLDDPARAARAKAEGWTVPTDVAGADSDKWS